MKTTLHSYDKEDLHQRNFGEQLIIDAAKTNFTIREILSEAGAKRPMLVLHSFDANLFHNVYGTQNVDMVLFSDFGNDIAYDDVVEGVKCFQHHRCDFIISFGDESVISMAKNISLFSTLDADKNFFLQDWGYTPIKHLAIPTTAGLGSESTKFSMLHYKGELKIIDHDSILPDYVILDAQLLPEVPSYLQKSAMMGAICQAIDSLWSINSSQKSMKYAQNAIKLIFSHYSAYLQGSEEAAYYIMMAANYSGRAVNYTQLSALHDMAYKMAFLDCIDFGHALAFCLPAFWKHMSKNLEKCRDPRGTEHIQDVFKTLATLFAAQDNEEALTKYFVMLYHMKLEDGNNVLNAVPKTIEAGRLQYNPIAIESQELIEIYELALKEREECKKYRLLDEHKEKTLMAYDWFAKTCKEHGISYVVLGGAVVGALRHGGFVPWDDDIDIGIRLPELEKFRRISKASLPPGFAWSHPDTNKKHPRLFGKIVYQGRCCLDVFPIVKTPGNMLLSKIHHKTIRFLYKVYLQKIRYDKVPKRLKNKIKRYIFKIVALFFHRDTIIKFSEKVMGMFEKKEAARYISICGRYKHHKELIEKEWIELAPEYVSFEGRMIPVFYNYQDYLTRLYNNYMIMPPFKSRKSDHNLRIKMYNINGFIPEYMPKLQQMECDMLQEFIAICEKYNLRYYAISGTALGAVRHKGFIPWDDDVDIAMPREDYDRFLAVAGKHLSKHLFLQTYKTEKGCPRFFAKIRNSNTTFIEVGAKKDTRNRGIYIDIFPMDGYPRNKWKQLECMWKNYLFDACIHYIYHSFSLKKVLLYKSNKGRRIIKRFIGAIAMHTKYRGYDLAKINLAKEEYVKSFSYDESELICSYGGVYGKKEIIPKHYLGEGVFMQFENLTIRIPERYDDYLKHFYGDYMQMPPEHTRSVGHPREIVDLNRSYRYYQQKTNGS